MSAAATSRGSRPKVTGRWGLNLCPTCHGRLLVRERRDRLSLPALVEAALAAGGPPEWPLCEWCGEDVDAHGLGYFTALRKPRRFCSVECRQTHNSRVSADQISAAVRDRIRRGVWTDPKASLTPEQLSESGRRAAAVYAERVHAQREAGTWVAPQSSEATR